MNAAFLPVVALAWAVLLVFHPATHDDMYADLAGQVTGWLTVHIGGFVLLGLTGLGLHRLVRDLPGAAARVSRLAIGTFVLFYGAAEAVLGIALGVLVRHANEVPADRREEAAGAVQVVWDDVTTGHLIPAVGAAGWIVGVWAAAAAFRRAGAPRAVPLLLVGSSLVAFHPFPLGPIGLLSLTAAAVLLARAAAVRRGARLAA